MRSFPHLLLILVLLLILENVRAQPNKPLLINCGSNSSSDVVDGRAWVGDARPAPTDNFTLTLPGAAANATRAPNSDGGAGGGDTYGELYRTARVFNASSAYNLSVAAGSYFLRLHFSQLFSNLTISGKEEEAVFDVTANGLGLLSKFSVPGEIYWRNTRSNSTSDVIVKEYLLNVTSAKLEVEFVPDAGSFAFVNAIEVVPVPGVRKREYCKRDIHGNDQIVCTIIEIWFR